MKIIKIIACFLYLLVPNSSEAQDKSITAEDLLFFMDCKDHNQIASRLTAKGFQKVDNSHFLSEQWRKDRHPPYITDIGGESVFIDVDNLFSHSKSVEYVSHDYMNSAASDFNYEFLQNGFIIMSSGNTKNRLFTMSYRGQKLLNIKYSDYYTSRGYYIDLPSIRLTEDLTGQTDFSKWHFSKKEETSNKSNCSPAKDLMDEAYRNANKGYVSADNNDELQSYARRAVKATDEILENYANCVCTRSKEALENGKKLAKIANSEDNFEDAKDYLRRAKNAFSEAIDEMKNCN